jgi:hypothetical protein
VRFKANSGFHFKIDPPQYSLTTQGLTVTQNIAKIRADGLSSKFQLGPCAWVGAGVGVQLTDVKYVYKARPLINLGGQACQLVWNNEPNSLQISIGDLNIIGVQNDLDKLAKDAAREAINYSLDAYFGSALRGELQKVVIGSCGAAIDRTRLRTAWDRRALQLRSRGRRAGRHEDCKSGVHGATGARDQTGQQYQQPGLATAPEGLRCLGREVWSADADRVRRGHGAGGDRRTGRRQASLQAVLSEHAWILLHAGPGQVDGDRVLLQVHQVLRVQARSACRCRPQATGAVNGSRY